MKTIDEIHDIEKEGWKLWETNRFDSCDRHWFKRVDTPTRCFLNTDKRGVQIELREWDSRKYGRNAIGYDLNFSAEMADGRWFRSQIGVEATIESIDAGVKAILVSWEVVSKIGNNK